MTNWHDFFIYDEKTGNLVWRTRPREHFVTDASWCAWTTKYCGKPAGSKRMKLDGRKAGIYITLHGKTKAAHTIIWEMFDGPIPEGKMVDHINCDQFDNRRSNFRLATQCENMQNARKRRFGNNSGIKGVHRSSDGKAWIAQVNHLGSIVFAKRFSTKGLAAVARAKVALRYHGKFMRIA